MYIFYTSMRIYLLSPQINHDLIRIFQQREVIAMLSVKANMVVISPDKENLTLENWICSTENNLTNHSQKFPRIMFIFGDIMNLRESYIEDMKPSIILEIEREIKILESELCTEALQQDKKQIDDFHWITDYLLLDSAVILFRRIVISSTTFDVTSVAKANHILHLALLIKRADYQKSSYYYMWPIALVLAAIELEDEVKRDWIQTFISNIVKKRSSCTNGLLLFIREACRRQSNSPKIKIDIFEVINDYKIEIMV